jgi:S-adenosylmethionine uptake transporter
MKFGPAARAASGIAVLSIMDAVIKGMAAFYPIFQVAFLRFACGSLTVAGVVAIMRPGWPSRETVLANAIRSPMFIALFGLLMLKEKVDVRIIGAIAIGFAGTLIVVLGQTEEASTARSWTGVAAALTSAVTYALSLVLLRQRAQRDKFLHIVVFQNVGPAVLVMGLLGFMGHMLMVTAYAKAEAARLAPLEYTALIWAVLIGYGVFSEIPTWATLGGGLLIVAAAMLTSKR